MKAKVAGCTHVAELFIPAKDFHSDASYANDARVALRRKPMCPGCPTFVDMVKHHRLHKDRASDKLGRFSVAPLHGSAVAAHNASAYKKLGASPAAIASRVDGLHVVRQTVRAPECDGFIAIDGPGFGRTKECQACNTMARNSLRPAQDGATKPRSKQEEQRRTAPDSQSNKR